jgi:hypothetical protein
MVMSKALIAAVAAGTAAAGTASAAHIDFVDYTAANGEQGVADGFSDDFNGVSVTFSTTDGDPNRFFAYFDGPFDGRVAGLGLCEVMESGPGSECLDTSQDNIRAGSNVMLTFSSAQILSGFSFSDKEHFSLNSNDANTLLVGVNGGALSAMTFADMVAATFTGVTSITFGFDGQNGVQYYVNSLQTPLPAAAPLLLAGIAGLTFASRRKRAAAI